MSDSERAPGAGEDPSRAAQLHAARMRALFTFAGTLIVCGGLYYFIAAPHDVPPSACTKASDCGGIGAECLHAPTGAYCTHSCDRDEDCDPGTHCDVPPWEKERGTRTLCIHDTAKIGTH